MTSQGFALLLAVLCVLGTLLVLALAGSASGSATITGKVRAPLSAAEVKLYLKPPADYEVIGIVEASSDAGWTEQGSHNYAVQELKKQAAKLGANGALLLSTGTKNSTMISSYGTAQFYTVPITLKTVRGNAIFVKGQ